ncbi:MAG: HDOD domain-containing protein [Spirochaetota bacterium]
MILEGSQKIENNSIVLNPQNYREAIDNNSDLYLQFSVFTPEAESHFIKVLHLYLEKLDLLYLKDMLVTIIKELVNNAIKANAKRLYFKSRNMDITKKDEYRKGMEDFKNDVFVKGSELLQKLANSRLVVRIFFKMEGEDLRINIINNIPILEEELNKIQARQKKAYSYTDISDAFDDVLDDSEGAGLGLIMALMLFKNAGFPPDAFEMKTDGKFTIAAIKLSTSLIDTGSQMMIAEEISTEVENLPSFPENILEIQRLCTNPESTIKDISNAIKRDPGLTTAILKLANSAGYITSKRVETIEEAVKIIGTKGINTLLVASGVQEIMGARYKKFETIWKNSYKSAFYSQNIAMQMKKTKLSEFAYLAALLSDIGQIVLLSIKPDEIQRLRDIAGLKDMPETNLLEEISLGISHSTLGSIICQKWRFNEALVKAIEFHHRPHMAPEKFRDLIYIVYLGYVYNSIETKNFRFEIVNDDVLQYFNIQKREEFVRLHNILKDSYEMHIEEKSQKAPENNE